MPQGAPISNCTWSEDSSALFVAFNKTVQQLTVSAWASGSSAREFDAIVTGLKCCGSTLLVSTAAGSLALVVRVFSVVLKVLIQDSILMA